MSSFFARSQPAAYRYGPLLALAPAILLPYAGGPYVTTVAIGMLTFAMLGLGLNIVVGFAGLLDLGYAAFFAIGAYTTGVLTTKLGFAFWETLPLAIGMAALAGALLGYPTLRLRSDYLAIVTLGFGEMVRITFTNLEYTGGPEGIQGIPRPSFFGYVIHSQTQFYYLGLALLMIVLWLVRNLARSRYGRAWLALREDESAAEAVGVPSIRVKLWAYVMGAMWAGVAGAFFAARLGVIAPQSFTYLQSVTILIVVVLGGMASLPGMVLGAVVVVGLPELLRGLGGISDTTGLRMFLFALGLIVLMILRPQGLWPQARVRGNPFAGLADRDGEAPGHDARAAGLGAAPAPAGAPSADGEPILEVDGLVKTFGGLRAVDNVSFSVERGEIFSIIGPNGAGKTTVFNCVTGVLRADSGEVRLEGRSLRGLAPHQVVRRGLARTFQGIRLFQNMPVFANVQVGMFPREQTGIPHALVHNARQRREERRSLREARDLLRFLGLDARAGLDAKQLSYGDQRRLEIARALANGPRLLLLDEPAAGMNPSEKEELVALVRRIRGLGITVVLIEHDMTLVMSVSDRVAVLDRGALIALGAPDEVQDHPQVIEAYLGSGDDDEDEEV